MPVTTLISTVGTSLFFPNLAGLKPDDADPLRARLAQSYAAQDWPGVAAGFALSRAFSRNVPRMVAHLVKT